MTAARRAIALLTLTFAAAGCGGSSHHASSRFPTDQRPIPAGRGPGYRLAALSPPAARGLRIAGVGCRRHHPRSYAVHIELYARGLVLPVPSGIGVAPPVRRQGAYVRGGRCSYAVRTFEPTGLVLVDAHRRLTVGSLFAIWGRPLMLTRLAGFTGPVLAYVNGHRWFGSPARIRLRRHAQIVIEADGYVTPHPSYEFPPGH